MVLSQGLLVPLQVFTWPLWIFLKTLNTRHQPSPEPYTFSYFYR